MAEPGSHTTLGLDELEPEAFTLGDYRQLQAEDDQPGPVPAKRRTLLEVVAVEDLSWHDHAACRPENKPNDVSLVEWVDMFFPNWGESTAAARSYCRDCPVFDDCREAGMGEKHGVWGGSSERQRRRVRRTRAAA